jgi:serine phosphatase RsbU (regulator of sigma subunit)
MPTIPELSFPLHQQCRRDGQTALLIDEAHSRKTLRPLLEAAGYRVLETADPKVALEYFTTERPNIVFIDQEIAGQDGHQAVRRMLSVRDRKFIPFICLSAQTDEKAYASCIELGGHDFLTKPVSPIMLKAKLHSFERVRQIHSDAMRLHGQMRVDQEMAETVFNGAVIADNIKRDCLNTIIKPAEQFNGDVLLSAYAPSSDVHILLGDFTGHGLAAAFGALPAAEVFRAMTAKGFSPQQIVSGINQKLYSLLPTGMFFAIQFIAINHDLDYIKVINCGMPDILLLDGASGSIRQRFSSQSFPLGIAPDIEYQERFVRAKITPGDRILLVSDGVTEARNRDNAYFGKARLERALLEKRPDDPTLDSVLSALTAFCEDAPQDDDISLADIPCVPELLPRWAEKGHNFRPIAPASSAPIKREVVPATAGAEGDPLEFSITLPGNRLNKTDPIPLLINHIQEMEGLHRHRRLLFTLLSELYVNALDHGLLNLNSEVKSSTDGFAEYFAEREKRLQHLDQGFINIAIQSHKTAQGGKIKIRVEDSGPGFDLSIIDAYLTPELNRPSGRGIQLLHSLCDSVNYEEPGNKVAVIFSWVTEAAV